MKKSLIALLLVLAACLSLTACGAPKETYSLGDTVSTDIFSFTLDEAALAIAVHNVHGENFFLPKEYSAQDDSDNPYVAPTGQTLVTFTYTVENIGRSSAQLYRGSFSSVKYNGKVYRYGVEAGAVLSPSSGKWESETGAGNILVDAGETETHRAYTTIGVEAESLTDGFSITFAIPNSSGKTEKFTYIIG